MTVHNTAATEMAQKLADIFQVAQLGGKRGAGAPPAAGAPGAKPAKAGDLTTELMISKIIPDERSNQLIVIATERAYARVLMLVKKLDVPIEGGDGAHPTSTTARTPTATSSRRRWGPSRASRSWVRRAAGRAGARRPRRRPRRRRRPGARGAGKENLLFEGEVRINFDRPTNSLIVVSSLKDYQSLRRVIELLDSPRKQVFVEAMILEVTIDKERDLGASWHGAFPHNLFGMDNPSLIVGGLNPSKTLFPASALGDTMLAGVLGPVLSASEAQSLGTSQTTTVDIPSFGVLIKALQTNSDVDVLSNPHLLIMNNEEGEISVGQRIPLPREHVGPRGGGGGLGRRGPGRAGRVGRGRALPAGAAREGRARAQAVAARQRARPHPARGRREDLGGRAGREQPRAVDVRAHGEDDRRRQGSADDPHRRPHVRQGHRQRHEDPESWATSPSWASSSGTRRSTS